MGGTLRPGRRGRGRDPRHARPVAVREPISNGHARPVRKPHTDEQPEPYRYAVSDVQPVTVAHSGPQPHPDAEPNVAHTWRLPRLPGVPRRVVHRLAAHRGREIGRAHV